MTQALYAHMNNKTIKKILKDSSQPQANSSQDPISKNQTQKRTGGVAQTVTASAQQALDPSATKKKRLKNS
jgi:hypothetical protein